MSGPELRRPNPVRVASSASECDAAARKCGRIHSIARQLGRDEHDERRGHRRQRAPDHDPGRDADRERERGVADHDDAAFVEQRRGEPVGAHGIDRARPPGDHQAEQSRDGHCGQADDRHLRDEPARARDALGPREAERAGFELACDERRSPEHSDDRGHDEEQATEPGVQRLVIPQERVLGEVTAALTAARRDVDVVEVVQVRTGQREHDCDDQQSACGNDGLRARLEPREPDHRIARSPDRRAGFASRAWLMYASTTSSIVTGVTVHAGSRIGSSVRTSSTLCLSVWLLLDHVESSRAGCPAPGAGPTTGDVRGQQRVDVARELHVRRREHDEVVADAFEIGDEVRREDDAHAVPGDDLHEVLEELAARQWVEARNRLVEQQHLGPLRDGEGERELRPLAARERSRALARDRGRADRCGPRRARRPNSD